MRFMYAVKLHLSDNARSDVEVASVGPTTSMREQNCAQRMHILYTQFDYHCFSCQMPAT